MENCVRASAQLQGIPQRPRRGHQRQHFGDAFSGPSHQEREDHRIEAKSKRATCSSADEYRRNQIYKKKSCKGLQLKKKVAQSTGKTKLVRGKNPPSPSLLIVCP